LRIRSDRLIIVMGEQPFDFAFEILVIAAAAV
jgi:hypothetical protein